MNLQVMSPTLLSQPVCVGERTVDFDENGVSPELTQAEFDRLLSIPGFTAVPKFKPRAKKQPEAAVEVTPEGSDDIGQDIPPHDEDASLYDRFQACRNKLDFFAELPLLERLDLGSNPRLTEAEATEMFAWEQCGRKSRRVLTALDKRLQLLRQTKNADTVNRALLTTNFPPVEEQ